MAAGATAVMYTMRPSPGRSRFSAARAEARALLSEILALDLRDLERLDVEELSQRLAFQVRTWLQRAVCIMEEVSSTSETEIVADAFADQPTLTFELQVDSLMVAGSGASTMVADIAFMAKLELSQRLQQTLSLSSSTGEFELLSQYDSALRRIRKSLSALESAIANLEGDIAEAPYTSELAVSLRVRAAYAKLRTALLADGEPTPSTLFRRMRAAGTQIAMLVGRDIYPELRVRDRIQIRQLQARILEWLRADGHPDELTGVRLWRDLDAFIRMLGLVNKRQELLAHDMKLLQELPAKLAAAGPDLSILSELEALRGLDDELDAMLDNQDAVEPSYWLDVVTRLQAMFGRSSTPEWG